MTTSKHIDKICIATVIIACILTVAVIVLYNMGIFTSETNLAYEDKLFTTDEVHTIDIQMDDWDSFIESCESEEYTSCTVVIDGETYSNIAIRGKGNTSLSNVSSMDSERYSFKLEFDHYQDGNTYYGLDKLCLNNLIQDNTMMKDFLTYQMMADFGVDAPLCSFTYITVNGEDWGLYLAVESVEDSFLARNYGSESGNLYKPDSMSFGGGVGNGKNFDINNFKKEDSDNSDTENTNTGNNNEENLNDSSGFSFGGGGQAPPDFSGDFDPSSVSDANMNQAPPNTSAVSGNSTGPGANKGSFDFGMGSDDVKLKYIDDDVDSYSNIFDSAKTDVSNSDKKTLIESLKNLSEYSNLEETLDIEEVLRYFVVHNYVCNGDSYTGSMIHNYYLYEEDGQLSMIPWDYNLAYGTFQGGDASSTVNTSIDEPVSGDVDDRPMVGWIFSDEEYTQMYHELFAEFMEEWYESGKMEQLISDTAELIRPYVESDPTKFCTTEEFDTGVDALLQFVEYRSEAVTKQLAGDNSEVDTNGLSLSDMGTMSNGGGMGGGPSGDHSSQNTSSDDDQSSQNFDPNNSSSTNDSTTDDSNANSQSFGPGNAPGGGDFDPSNMPEDFDPSNMPSGDNSDTNGQSFGPGNMPGGGNFDPSNMPDDFDPSNMPSGDNSDTNGQSFGPGNMPGGGDFDPSNMPQNFDQSNTSGDTSDSSFIDTILNYKEYALVGGSILILGIGLLIAAKKKY